jgi:hypothetical protein
MKATSKSNKMIKRNRESNRVMKVSIRNQLAFKQLKYFDYYNTVSSTITIGYDPITSIPQGATQGERVGDMIFLDHTDYTIHYTTANADIFNIARVIVFQWNPPSGSLAPGTTSILEDPNTFGVHSPYNYEGRQDYRILYDRSFALSGVASAPTINSNIIVRGSINNNYRRVVFNSGTISGTHKTYFLHLSDSSVAPNPALIIQFRTFYYDS